MRVHMSLSILTAMSTTFVLILVAGIVLGSPAAARSDAEEPYSPGARQVFVPALEAVGDDGLPCATEVVIQNVGAAPSKAIVLFWGEPGACGPTENGPMTIQCGGLMKPGMVWQLNGPMMPAGARSAIAFSANLETVELIDGLSMEDSFADYLCETLFFGLMGGAAEATDFRRAVNAGTEFAGVSMARALGAPLSVTVDRDCIGGSMRYVGIPSEDHSDGAVAGGSYDYVSPMLAAGGGRADAPSMIAMNTGLECATIQIFARAHLISDPDPEPGAECPTGNPCGTFTAAPGESVVIDPVSAACLDADGSAWIRSDQPLAIVIDGLGPAGHMSALAEQVSWSGAGTRSGAGGESPISGEVVARLSAPLVYNDFNGWSSTIHVANTTSDGVSARVTLWNRRGDEVSRHQVRLCPLGGRSVAVGTDMIGAPADFVGTVSIERVEAEPSGGGTDGAVLDELSAIVELTRLREDGTPLSSAAYDVRPASLGKTVIGIPSVVKTAETGDVSVLAIHNQVRMPGFTDFAVLFYDSNGLLDYVCNKVGANQVEYIDLETWGYVNPGFSGSAIVSAQFWEHDSVGADGEPRNDVSLSAVVMEMPNGLGRSSEIPEFPAGSTNAIMLPSFEAGFESGFSRVVCSSGPFPRPRTWRIYLPNVLRNR